MGHTDVVPKKGPRPHDGLKRETAGRYTTEDGRFTVTSGSSGDWYLADSERTDDFGLPRLIGPFPTLADVKVAMADARGREGEVDPAPGPPVLRLLPGGADGATTGTRRRGGRPPRGPTRPVDEAPPREPEKEHGGRRGGPGEPTTRERRARVASPRTPAVTDEAGAREAKRTRARRSAAAAKVPRMPAWLERLDAGERSGAAWMIERLTALGFNDAEAIVRADIEAGLPLVARAIAASNIRREAVEAWVEDPGLVDEVLRRRGAPGGGEDGDEPEAAIDRVRAALDEEALGVFARAIAARTAGRVLDELARERAAGGGRRDLPGWRVIEIGPDGEPTGRRLLLSGDDLERFGPRAPER